MALTPSTMIPLGSPLIPFRLPEACSGENRSLSELKGNAGTLILFICNHCPYVKHVAPLFSKLAREYTPAGLGIIAINSNDVQSFPEDHPDKMKEWWNSLGNPFPYLYDESQEVAQAYDAACTPDVYLYDAAGLLVYRGQIDDSRPSNSIPLSGKDLIAAIEDVCAKRSPSPYQKPGIGCNIKWKSGS